ASAGEYAGLASGTRMHIDRHEADGAKVRLFHGTGFVELDSAVVRGYGADEHVAEVPVPAQDAIPTEAYGNRAAVAPPTPLELADAAADRSGLPRELGGGVVA